MNIYARVSVFTNRMLICDSVIEKAREDQPEQSKNLYSVLINGAGRDVSVCCMNQH